MMNKCYVTSIVTYTILLSCVEVDKVTVIPCGDICYTGEQGTQDVGLCRAGITVCKDNGIDRSCEGEITPKQEICDELDNDCDGKIDEGFDNDGDGFTWCSGDCKDNDRTVYPGAEEVCDGVDNDCDGRVDNDILSVLCYEGDHKNIYLQRDSACASGGTECHQGQLKCMYQRLPQAEVCDGIDNDCDGLRDEGLGTVSEELDIVIVLDISGSMNSYLDEFGHVIRSWANDTCLGSVNCWAYILPLIAERSDFYNEVIPSTCNYDQLNDEVYCNAGEVPKECQKPKTQLGQTQPCDADILADALTYQGRRSGADELSLDLFFDILNFTAVRSSVTNEETITGSKLEFRPGVERTIIFFGDERPQTKRGLTVTNVGKMFIDADTSFIGFVHTEEIQNYNKLVNPNKPSSKTYDLNTIKAGLLANILTTLTTTCEQ